MDPGTALAVTQISAKVISTISKYYSDVKDAKNDIMQLSTEVEDLGNTVSKVEDLLSGGESEDLPVATQLLPTLESSQKELELLEKRLNPGRGDKMMRRVGKRALKWPFSKKEVEECIDKLQRFKATLTLALVTDQT